MRLLVVVSRYSVLAVIWMALSTTAHAQSTSCISSPDGNGGAVINCTTTSWGADRMSQSNTNCLRSSDGNGGSIANCTTNSYNYGSNAPTRGWLWGIAQGAASASDGWASYRAAHPNYVYPTPLSSPPPSVTEAACPEAADMYFVKGVREGWLFNVGNFTYDPHFVKGMCLIHITFRSSGPYIESISDAVADRTIAIYAKDVKGFSNMCKVNTPKGAKQCDGLDDFHKLVKKQFKF